MATVTLGSIKFNWKGAYNSSTAYAVDDVVSSGGNSYVCIQAHTNQAVGNATAYWNIMSAAGTNGTNGTDLTTTLTTQGDIVYRDGSGLQRLGAGTSGQFLKTQGSSANPVWADSGGATLQTVRTSSTSVVGSNNDCGSFTSNLGVGNGALALQLTITPQSAGSSHFYIHAQARFGVGGNSMGATGLFHGSTLIAGSMGNGYSADNANASIMAFIDTTGLSGSQTFSWRNLGNRGSAGTSYLNGNHGGSVAGTSSTLGNNNTRMHMVVQEIKD